MRAFIILCFVAAACAEQLGYNYQPVGHADGGLSFHGSSGPVGGSSYSDGSLGGGSLGGSSYAPSAPSGNPEFHKDFYSFTAPEGEFEDVGNAQDIANSLKKNLQIVFIKGPENHGLENAALALANHAADQKTAIYVLNKQSDIGDLAHKLNAANTNNRGRPEVHFVKYRTHEDAANAQRTIESQYHQLGGTSQNHNGGVAPVLNFASPAQVHAAPAQVHAAPVQVHAAPVQVHSSPVQVHAAPVQVHAAPVQVHAAPIQVHAAAARAPGNSYLPSSIFRR